MRTLKAIALAVFAAVVFMSCDSESTTATSPNGEAGATLSGTVLHENGKPFSNLNVKVKNIGVTTTTDANGKWRVVVPSDRKVAGRSMEGAMDSVVIATDSQVVASQAVNSYTAELPPLYIVQRDLYGTLANFTPMDYIVTAYMVYPDSSMKVIPLWHNAVAHAFSGYIYTVDVDAIVNYSVRVVVRNADDSSITGLSPMVPFNSTAGDVVIPVFSYNNVKPSASIAVTGTVKFGNTIKLSATVGDTDISSNGTMVVDNSQNTVQWFRNGKWENATVTNGVAVKSVLLDTSILQDSCYAIRVVDNQDTNMKAEQKVCFDNSELFQEVVTNKSAAMWTSTTGTFDASLTAGTANAGSVYLWVDSTKDHFKMLVDRQVNTASLNDTIDVGLNDRNNQIFIGSDTVKSAKRSITHVHVDSFQSFGTQGVRMVKLVLWSSTAAKIVAFGDTVMVKAGDNEIFVNRMVTDTSKLVLRPLYGTNGYSSTTERDGHFTKYATLKMSYIYAYQMYATGLELVGKPAGNTVATVDPENWWNPETKFVIKSVVGYRY